MRCDTGFGTVDGDKLVGRVAIALHDDECPCDSRVRVDVKGESWGIDQPL